MVMTTGSLKQRTWADVVRGGNGCQSLRAAHAGFDMDDVWPELRAGAAAEGSALLPDDNGTLDEQVRSGKLGGERTDGTMRSDQVGGEQPDGPTDQGGQAQHGVEAFNVL